MGDVQTVTFESEAVRDFALVISDGFQMAQGMAGDTLVTAYARDAGKAREMVKYAQQALETFGERYGTYLYLSLTLAEVDFPFGGMEYPRMVMMGSSLVEAGGRIWSFIRGPRGGASVVVRHGGIGQLLPALAG